MVAETRFVARETNATKRPSPLMATCRPVLPLAALPSAETSIALVLGVHAAATPAQVSRTKTFPKAPPATKFLASE